MTEALNWVATALAVIGAVVSGAFVWVYAHEPFDWKAYPAGRHLMRFTFGIFLVLTWSSIRIPLQMWYDDHPEFESLVAFGRLFIFGYVVIMVISRFRLLLQSRREGPRGPDPLP